MLKMFNGPQSPLAQAFHLCFAELPGSTKVLVREGAGKLGGGPLGLLPLLDQFYIERFLIIFIEKNLYY